MPPWRISGDIELQRGDRRVDLLAQAADGAVTDAAFAGRLSPKTRVAAEDMADGAVVVRVHDKGFAV